MIATSWGIDRPRHKMLSAAIVVDSATCAGVGSAGTKRTRPADPNALQQGGSTGHLERQSDGTCQRLGAQHPPKDPEHAHSAVETGFSVIPAACAAAPMGSGAKSVLQMLWSYASKWRPGDGPRFVWPSVETIADKLGRKIRGVYANLATLEREGWIVRTRDELGRKGWDLHPQPVERAPAEPEVEPDMQLGIAWPEPGDEASNEAPPPCAQPVEKSSAPAELRDESCNPTCTPVQLHPSIGVTMNHQDTAGQDSLRVFRAYEAHRVATLDGPPARTLPPPGLLTLWRELGGNAKAWKAVEAYGRRAIDIVAGMRDRGDPGWEQRERWRRDGGEWSRARFDAVMAYQGAAAEPQKPSAPPPPDPVVDGERVTLLEREAWDAGGEAAVRKQRSEALSSERLGELAGGFLAKLRGVG